MPPIANSASPFVVAAILLLGCDGPNLPRQFLRAEDYYDHGLTLSDDGQYSEAIDRFDQAIRLDPDQVDWFRSRSIARYQVADYSGSVSDLNEAIRREPRNARALNSRAWQLATCPDVSVRSGPQAIIDANVACELSDWKIAEWIDTLAAAHAEVGNFDAAVIWQKQAMATAPDMRKRFFSQRIELYESGEPYRQH
jgi:tetratricopeptide (TPR) repeat protein